MGISAEGMRKMVERLRQLAETTDPATNVYANDDRARMFRAKLDSARLEPGFDGRKGLPFQYKIGIESVLAGANREGLRELEEVLTAPKRYKVPLAAADAYEIRDWMVLAHLRIGEQDNCIAHHTAVSCLLPIAGEGIHKNQKGSRGAIPLLMEQLAERPDDLRSRWLLNIAYMTLGEYPGGVPAELLIDPKVFESDYDIGRFPEIAQKVGVNEGGLSGLAHSERQGTGHGRLGCQARFVP